MWRQLNVIYKSKKPKTKPKSKENNPNNFHFIGILTLIVLMIQSKQQLFLVIV